MANQEISVLTASEAEMFVQGLKAFDIVSIATPSWLQQHDHLEKLNMQAHLNAATDTDEFVMELLISYDKIATLVHELIAVEVWREKVYPTLKSLDFAEKSTMTPYIVLYHEATVMNLLETILYHKEAIESVGEATVDLVDYCNRRLVFLNANSDKLKKPDKERDTQELLALDGQAQLDYQTRKLPFDISVKAVSIARYLTDHITSVSLSVMTRILTTHDWPCAFVSLVANPPWTRYNNGQTEKYVDTKWEPVAQNELLRLTKLEGQVWLALYNLLMEPECRKKYHYNSHTKDQILRLRGSFNEVLIDQLPVLGALRRFLEELQVMEPPNPEPSLVIEQLPQVRDHLLKVNKGHWNKIAEKQHKSVFSNDPSVIKAQAKRLAETYNLDVLDSLFPEDPKCSVCGEPATSRCSRCQNEWYCRRQCQVEHWPKHKEMCKLITENK